MSARGRRIAWRIAAVVAVLDVALGLAWWHARGQARGQRSRPAPVLTNAPARLGHADEVALIAEVARLERQILADDPALQQTYVPASLLELRGRSPASFHLELVSVEAALPSLAIVTLEARVDTAGEVQTQVWREMLFWRDGDRYVYAPAARHVGAPTVAELRGALRIDPARHWLDADLQLTVEAKGGLPETIELRLPSLIEPRGRVDQGSDLRLIEVSQDGAACAFAIASGRLFVRPPRPAATVALRLRYQGQPPLDGGTYLSVHEALLRSVTPSSEKVAPRFDLTVTFPDAFELFTGASSEVMTGVPGWSRRRVRGDAIDAPALLAMRKPVERVEQRTDAGVRIALSAVDNNAEPNLAAITHALATFAPLGPLPTRDLDVVLVYQPWGIEGEVLGKLVLVRPANYHKNARTDVIAHELAHLWFGGVVPALTDENGLWWEAIAEYLAGLALDPAEARAQREERARAYDRTPPAFDVALTSRLGLPTGAGASLSYGKGMLIIAALDVRLGRAGLWAYLNAFLARYRGRPVTWDALVAVLAETHGAAHAAWLRAAVDRPGAPELELVEGRFAADRVTAVIVQPAPAWDGVVEVQVQRCDGKCTTLATHQVTLAGTRTPIELPLPAGANRLALDDETRFPRRRTSRALDTDGASRELTTTQTQR